MATTVFGATPGSDASDTHATPTPTGLNHYRSQTGLNDHSMKLFPKVTSGAMLISPATPTGNGWLGLSYNARQMLANNGGTPIMFIVDLEPAVPSASDLTTFLKSLPANQKICFCWFSEAEGDATTNGAAYVANIHTLSVNLNSALTTCAAPGSGAPNAGSFYTRSNFPITTSARMDHYLTASDTSYIPAWGDTDYYGTDFYHHNPTESTSVSADARFQHWLTAVRTKLGTSNFANAKFAFPEYGVNSLTFTEAQRAATLQADYDYVQGLGQGLYLWNYWYQIGNAGQGWPFALPGAMAVKWANLQGGGGGGSAPVVTVTQPASGASIAAGADVLAKATVTDADSDLSTVTVKLDTQAAVTATLVSGSYQHDYGTALAPGNHTITYTATDAAGHVTTGSVTFSVASAGSPPAVTITQPAVGQSITFGGDVLAKATVTDPDNDLATVTVKLDTGAAIAATLISGSYQHDYGTALAVGTHTLVYTATDAAGNVTTKTVTFSVASAGSPPAVTITQPAVGQVFTQGDDVLAKATVTDTDGDLSTVTVKLDTGGFVAATLVSGSYQHDYGTALAIGTHTVTYTATDAAGNATTRAVTFTVQAPIGNPTVTVQSPLNGSNLNDTGPIVASVTAAAQGSATITGVTSKLDGGSAIAMTLSGGVWSHSYAGPFTDAAHTITFVATDSNGATTTAATTFTAVSSSWNPTYDLRGNLPLGTLSRAATMQVRSSWSATDGGAEAVRVAKEVAFISGNLGTSAGTGLPYKAQAVAADPTVLWASYEKDWGFPVASDSGGTKFPAKWYAKYRAGGKVQQGGTYVNWLMETGMNTEARASATVDGVTETAYAAWHLKQILAQYATLHTLIPGMRFAVWYDTAGTFGADNAPHFWQLYDATTAPSGDPGWNPHLIRPYGQTPVVNGLYTDKTDLLDMLWWVGDLSRNGAGAPWAAINTGLYMVCANGALPSGANAKASDIAGHYDMVMSEGWTHKFGTWVAGTSQASAEGQLQTAIDVQLVHGSVFQVLDWAQAGYTAAQFTQFRRVSAGAALIAQRTGGGVLWEFADVKSDNPAVETAKDPNLYNLQLGAPLHEPTVAAANYPLGHRVPVGTSAGQASAVGLLIQQFASGTVVWNYTTTAKTYHVERGLTRIADLQDTSTPSYATGAAVVINPQSATLFTSASSPLTAPSNTTAPVVTPLGASPVGTILTTTDGAWSGSTPMTPDYQWQVQAPTWPATGVLFGSYVDLGGGGESQAEITTREAALGREYAIDEHFYGSPVPSDGFPEWDIANGRLPLITTAFGWGQGAFPGYSSVTSGAQNAILDAWATYLKGLHGPCILRIFQEQNGNWFNYGTGAANYSTGFKAMWQYIYNRWKAAGVDLGGQVQLCWCPNTEFNTTISSATTDASYPGDAYVDVIGVDLYNKDSAGTGGGLSFQNGFSGIYGRYSAKGKPFVVAEFGCVDHVANQRRDWFNAMRTYINGGTVPLLKGIVYWDARGTGTDPNTSALFEYRTDQTTSGTPSSATNSFTAWSNVAGDAGFAAVYGASWTNVAGATSAQFNTTGHATQFARCGVRETNAAGSSSRAYSNAVGPFTSTISAPGWASGSGPTITGSAAEGGTLTCVVGTTVGTPLPSAAFQWQSSSTGAAGSWTNLTGETANTYAVPVGSAGLYLRCNVTLTNGVSPNAVKATPSVGPVTSSAVAPHMAGSPVITVPGGGAPFVGSPVSASVALDAGTPPFTYTYSWELCDAGGGGGVPITGATSQTYIPTPADVGGTLRVFVTVANSAGSVGGLSFPTSVVTGPSTFAPVNQTAPVVSPTGPVPAGTQLTTTNGTWAGTLPMTADYQWQYSLDGVTGWTNIGGATNPFRWTTGDAGRYLRCGVRMTNSVGASSRVYSNVAGPVTSASSPPTFAQPPTISGQAVEAATLTVAAVQSIGQPPPTTTYQWQSSPDDAAWTNVGGATASTLVLPGGSAGTYRRCMVTLSNGNLPNAVQATNSLGPIVAAASAPHLTQPPTIILQGGVTAPTVGVALSAAVSAVTGTQPITDTWEWQSYASSGSTTGTVVGSSQSYTPTLADAGRVLRVTVTATNSVGSDTGQSASSAPVVTPVALPVNTVRPLVTPAGTSPVGTILHTTDGSWTGTLPMTADYQWSVSLGALQPFVNVAGATQNTFDTAAYLNQYARCGVRMTNGAGQSTRVQAAPVGPFTAVTAAPVFLDTAVVNGEAVEATTLTVNPGRVSGLPAPTLTYQWLRDGAAIGGATNSSYLLVLADVGSVISCTVTATNGVSPNATETAPYVGPVTAAATGPHMGIPVLIWPGSDPQEGVPLTIEVPDVTGTPPLIYAWSWKRCDAVGSNCQVIAGATGQSYAPSGADVGHTLRGSVGISNSIATTGGMTPASPVVIAAPPPPPAPPPISHSLGCGLYDVMILSRGGEAIRHQLSQWTSLKWSRQDGAPGSGELDLSGLSAADFAACCAALRDVLPWADELAFYRRRANDLVGTLMWCGPIGDAQLNTGKAQIPASDLLAWFDVRFVHNDHAWADTDLTEIAAALMIDGLAPDPSPGIVLEHSGCGIRGSMTVLAAEYASVGEKLRSLVEQGLRLYSTRRTVTASGYPEDELTFTDSSFQTPPQIKLVGSSQATRVEVTGQPPLVVEDDTVTQSDLPAPQATSQASDDLVAMYGLIERAAQTDSTIQESVQGDADRWVAEASQPVAVVESGVLSQDAAVVVDDLLPGRRCRVRLTDQCYQVDGQYRLSLVEGEAAAGTERVTVHFTPLEGGLV